MQALDRDIHGLAVRQQIAVEIAPHAVADHRVAEHVRRDGLEIFEVLRAHGIGRFFEHEELVLEAGEDLVAHAARAIEHPSQQGARAHGRRGARKLRQKEQHRVFPRQRAAGLGHDARLGVRIAGVPARELHVVVELVLAVPAQHHIAEAEATLERGEELGCGHVLAPQHAVDVEGTHLHVAQAPRLDDGARLGGAADLAGVVHGCLRAVAGGRDYRTGCGARAIA